MGLSKTIQNDIIEKAKQYEAITGVILFGSRATGQFRPESDIDLAIQMNPEDPHALRRFREQLEEEIRTPLKFDIISETQIKKPELKAQIRVEGIPIYEK